MNSDQHPRVSLAIFSSFPTLLMQILKASRNGLDHGTWSVLLHLYPRADIPVVQLSIDETQPATFHYEIGERLAQLREEGILILGSGNIVHNLHAYAWGRHAPEPYDWAISFETRVRDMLLAGEYKPLINYEHQLGTEAELAVPTPDHYLPLLYVAGTRTSSEPVITENLVRTRSPSAGVADRGNIEGAKRGVSNRKAGSAKRSS